MATRTFTFPTGSYPSAITTTTFTRTDTDADVVAVWTDGGSGVWTLTFTPPAAGLTYAFTGTATINSVVSGFDFTFTDSSSGFEGRYTTSAALKLRFKSVNIAAYSTSDASDVADESAVQAAIEWAEDEIDARLSGGSYTVPLVATGSALPAQVKEWANVGAVWQLYQMRGLNDDKKGGDFQAMFERIFGTETMRGEIIRSRNAYPRRKLLGVELKADRASPAAQAYNSSTGSLSSTADGYRVRFIEGYGFTVVYGN